MLRHQLTSDETGFEMAQKSKTTLLGWLGQQFIAFFFCVGFPGLVTAIAPASWLSFQRDGERVTATAKTCVFFVIPYRVQHVEYVAGVSDRIQFGGTSTTRRNGRTETTKADDEGFLQIKGGGESSAEVSVSPYSLKDVVERAGQFLEDPTQRELNLFVIANWKFGLIMGGFLSLFTVLYVVGVAMSVFNAVWKGLETLRSLGAATSESTASQKA